MILEDDFKKCPRTYEFYKRYEGTPHDVLPVGFVQLIQLSAQIEHELRLMTEENERLLRIPPTVVEKRIYKSTLSKEQAVQLKRLLKLAEKYK